MAVTAGVVGSALMNQAGDRAPTLRCQVVNRFPHDPAAYCQGLVYHNGWLYEGTGDEGRSSIRRVELTTGKVVQQRNLADNMFGEGITIWDKTLIQLTWKNRVALHYDVDSPSKSNYEWVFAHSLADLGGTALITEYAQAGPYWLNAKRWIGDVPGRLGLRFLTRMRTVLSPEQMELDFEFRYAPDDELVENAFSVQDWPLAGMASLAIGPLGAFLLFSLLRLAVGRKGVGG